jgi:radical SAM protein (TIGR01212 family)
LERGVTFLSKRYKCKKFIAYFQSFTNTYAEVELLARLYREACSLPEIVGLAVGTRPDCVPDAVLDLLAEHARSRLVWIEYGLQSAHSRTLALINRGHGPDAFFDTVKRTNERGLLSVAHLILGLPGESLDDMLETARAVTAAGTHGVKLHPLYVVEDTQLARMCRDGSYRPITEAEALNATLAILETISPDMVIHRLTSDPHAEELIAPLWMLDKTGVRNRLNKAMRDRNLVQGSRFILDNAVMNRPKSEATPKMSNH